MLSFGELESGREGLRRDLVFCDPWECESERDRSRRKGEVMASGHGTPGRNRIGLWIVGMSQS